MGPLGRVLLVCLPVVWVPVVWALAWLQVWREILSPRFLVPDPCPRPVLRRSLRQGSGLPIVAAPAQRPTRELRVLGCAVKPRTPLRISRSYGARAEYTRGGRCCCVEKPAVWEGGFSEGRLAWVITSIGEQGAREIRALGRSQVRRGERLVVGVCGG